MLRFTPNTDSLNTTELYQTVQINNFLNSDSKLFTNET